MNNNTIIIFIKKEMKNIIYNNYNNYSYNYFNNNFIFFSILFSIYFQTRQIRNLKIMIKGS